MNFAFVCLFSCCLLNVFCSGGAHLLYGVNIDDEEDDEEKDKDYDPHIKWRREVGQT